MGKSKQEEEIEDVTVAKVKEYPILYVKRVRRTLDKKEKIQNAINEVYLSVKKQVKYHISLRVIYEIWPGCIASVKDIMKFESHYADSDLVDDEEDLDLFHPLLADDLEKNLAEWKEDKRKKKELRDKKRSQKENVQKSAKKHRTGTTSKLPLKSKKTVTHPRLDTFAQKKVQQQEALVAEFQNLKEQFTKSTKQIAEENNTSDYWAFVCEKYQSILPEDYDACTYEVLGEFQKIFEEE